MNLNSEMLHFQSMARLDGGLKMRLFVKMAFTLMEPLVVIAIITILAARLLPALSQAVFQARRINGASNLQQIAVALQLYVDEYHRYAACASVMRSRPSGQPADLHCQKSPTQLFSARFQHQPTNHIGFNLP